MASHALERILPGIAQFRGYRRSWLRGDVLAGITVAAYLVPQVMAYAEIAGLPPVAGLWTAIGPMAVYALLGTSRRLSVGPESTTALMTATAVAPLATGDPGRYAVLAAVLAVLVGGVCLFGGLVRAGVVADLLSKPVLVGYLAGIAVSMIVSQLGALTGVPVHGHDLAGQLRSWFGDLGAVHWPTLALGASVLTLLLLLARFAPWLPGPLLGIVLAAGFVWIFGWQHAGIQVVGVVPAGLPVPAIPRVGAADLSVLLLPAVGIALVGFSDVVLTARAFAPKDGQAVDADKELRALGGTNLIAGLSHGFPVSSSGSRTAIGVSLGSRTQLYSLVALATVLVVLFAGGPLLGAIPEAALGAVVVYAGLRLIRPREFQRFGAFRRSELVLALATTAGVLGLGVLYGVLVAIGLSILDLLRRMARPHAAVLGYVPGVPGMHDIGDYPGAEIVPGLVVYRYDAPLCFANAQDFHDRALRAVTPGTEWFLLNAEATIEVDVTGLDALDGLCEELKRRGIRFAMARVKRELDDELAAAGLMVKIGEENVFPTLPAAVAEYVRSYRAEHGRLPEGMTAPVLPPNPMVP
ncbi:SulP family inorganic anion transporter [Amycolatopsis pithecellobii]|uniref:Sulfate permease n=1 Tax=Amycolatopsis pithecellobii TaxID=664692 RepID=A0A6N7ZD33_9PSEU|nr:SulP family inorganic anion transporter [Amycolatopsis pithecellobii]MTD59605.1 sulfate permease [Amycolatopsis pithecellobii]